MKGVLNPELKSGDKIVCYHMEGETGVPPGTTGVVSNVGRDPFEKDGNTEFKTKLVMVIPR